MHQRRGRFPGLHHLLPASATRPFLQTASGTLLHGLVTLFCNTNYTTTPYILWRHRWNAFLRYRLTANPLIPLLPKRRIFGQSRICPLPIPTGTIYLSTLPRCILPALTVSMCPSTTWIMAYHPPSVRFRIRGPMSLSLYLPLSSPARQIPKVRNDTGYMPYLRSHNIVSNIFARWVLA